MKEGVIGKVLVYNGRYCQDVVSRKHVAWPGSSWKRSGGMADCTSHIADMCRFKQYSIDYATFVLLVAPFMATNFVMNHCLRAEGSATLSLIGMGIGGIINCFLDPLFILPSGLNLGVRGASIATAISKLISFAILLFPYLRRHSVVRLGLKYFKPKKDTLYQILSVGSSSFFRVTISSPVAKCKIEK